MEEIFDFENLLVYKKALAFIDEVYAVCGRFPPIERFALADQFRRAATSIALNIAEGTGGSRIEFKKFLKIARRSIRECVAIMTIAGKRNYFNPEKEIEMRIKAIELSKMISGLMASLR
ncbi:MAG: four helix bundle protein [Candidatus Margulisbacteria bacterium]|nr:four helix bundle protein [Candidatus Margulisiibacteriota bacterium]